MAKSVTMPSEVSVLAMGLQCPRRLPSMSSLALWLACCLLAVDIEANKPSALEQIDGTGVSLDFTPVDEIVQTYDWYCAYPEVIGSNIANYHESIATGPLAYMYMTGYGGAKKGNTVDYLGTGGPNLLGVPSTERISYDNNVWGSNFQGSKRLVGESARPQWEWGDVTSNGGAYSGRRYPLTVAYICHVYPPGSTDLSLESNTISVYEDDECVSIFCNPDDYVGFFTIDRNSCLNEVFDAGYLRGWTTLQSDEVGGDINYVWYRNWCYTCLNAPNCAPVPENGVGPLLPASAPCPTGKKCCESGPNNSCSLCVPHTAACP
jgi:hypothetical protein